MLKRKVIRILAWLSYWCMIDWLFYFLNRKSKRVLCFHHVLPDDIFVPHVNGFEVRESEFRSLIREIRKHFTLSTDINDAETITITFDDGWRNQYTTAANVLKEEGNLAAILFVAGDLLDCKDAKKSLPIELMANWIAFVPEGRYEIIFRESKYVVEISDSYSRGRVWRGVLRPMFEGDMYTCGRSVVEALNSCWSIDHMLNLLPSKYVEERLLGVSQEQLVDLRNRGWRIGWHSKTHYQLSLLDGVNLENEFNPPACVGRDIIAYPYGDEKSVGCCSREFAKTKGFGAAMSFTTYPRVGYDNWFRPRIEVPCDKYQMHFVLSGFRHFLKYHRLLPRVAGNVG